jgi:hypothetical protein
VIDLAMVRRPPAGFCGICLRVGWLVSCFSVARARAAGLRGRTMKTALCTAALLCPFAHGTVILNGSFESMQHDAPGRYDIATLTDWTASGGYMLLEQAINGVSNIEAHSGTQYVSMGHSGQSGDTLAQSFATAAGQRYEVSFFVRSIQGWEPQSLTAEVIDDATQASLGSVVATVPATPQDWTGHSFVFVATGDAATLTLVHDTDSDRANIVVDSVLIVIPGPASLALLGLGLLAGRRR